MNVNPFTVQSPQVQELKQEISINKMLSLWIDVVDKETGEVLCSEPGHSLLAWSVYLFYTMMTHIPTPTDMPAFYPTEYPILSVSNVGGLVRCQLQASYISSTDTHVNIFGATGMTSLNGYWQINYISGSQFDLVGSGSIVGDVGSYNGNSAQFHRYNEHSFAHGNLGFYAFGSPYLRVGTNGAANTIDTRVPASLLQIGTGTGQVLQSAMNISYPAIQTVPSDQSEVTFSRDITNNSGATITVNEVCLFADVDNTWDVMIARDTITFAIVNGSTVTVNYRWRTANDGVEGIMIQLNELLTRRFRNEAREAKDINNNDVTDSRDWFDLYSLSVGGDVKMPRSENLEGWPADDFGPQIGTNNTAVSHSDVALFARCDHDESGVTNKCLHLGTRAHNLTVDTGTDVAYFDITKLFFNNSGGTIVVAELALYVNADNASDVGADLPYMIARTVPAATFNFLNNYYLAVTCRVKVALPP